MRELANLIPEASLVRELTDAIEAAQRTERSVLAAAMRGAFQEAESYLRELESMSPDSPRVPDLAQRIADMQADAQGAEDRVLRAVARGAFAEARTHLQALSGVTPDSPRVPSLQRSIELAQDTEQEVSAAVLRGAFDQARRLVKELEGMTPESPRVPDLAQRIESVHEDAQRVEALVSRALAQGDFEQAGRHVQALAKVTPDSMRVPALAKRIEAVRADEGHALDMVRSAIDRGEFERARTRVRELGEATPESPRVAEAASSIDRAQAEAHRAEQMVLAAIRAGGVRAGEDARAASAGARDSDVAAGLGDGEESRAGTSGGAAWATARAGGNRPGGVRAGREAPARGSGERDPGLPAGGGDGEEDRTGAGGRTARGAGDRRGDRAGGLRESPKAREDRCGPDPELTARGAAERFDRRGAGVCAAFRQAGGDGDRAGRFRGSPWARGGAGENDPGLAAGPGDAREDRSGAGDGAAHRAGGVGCHRAGRVHRSAEAGDGAGRDHPAVEPAGRAGELRSSGPGRRAETAERRALDAVAEALAAVDRGDHDARAASVEAARGHVTQLAAVTPGSRRVTELEAKIDRAELIPAMVRIRGGELKLKLGGGTTRRIAAEGFWLGKYEVTFDEYDRFAEEMRRQKPDDAGWGRKRRPVINVSWTEANEYVQWLSGKLGERYRLPTAAEWEFAARAGSVTEYPWGEKVGKNRANCKGCGSQWDRRRTAPVGSFPSNAWGLHDVVGNVYEWDVLDARHRLPRAQVQRRQEVGGGGRRKERHLRELFPEEDELSRVARRILAARRVTKADYQGEHPRADIPLEDARLSSRPRLSVQLSASTPAPGRPGNRCR